MLRLVTLAALTTYSLSVAFANPNLNFASIAMAEDVPFKMNYAPIDQEIGGELVNLYNSLLKNELKDSTIERFKQYRGKKHSFDHLNPIINRLSAVGDIKNQDSFFQNCTIQEKNVNEVTESIAHRMDITIDKYCRFLFLDRLQKLSPNVNFSSRDLAFLKEAAPFYILGENQSEVSQFLKHFKSNKAEHEKVSNILIEEYVKNKIKPSSAIMLNLHVSVLLNQFLQNNLHLDNNTGSYFQEEFQRISKDARDYADKGDPILAKQMIMSAVNFYLKNKQFIDAKKAWVGTILSAKALFYKGRDADAIEIFNIAKTIAPKEDTSESIFYLLWPHLINKDYKAMKLVVDKNNLEKNFDQFDSKLKYWIAYSSLKNGNTKKAMEYFNKIVSSSPYSFYSIISLKELAAQQKGVSETDILAKLVAKDSEAEFKISDTSETLQDSLRRLAVWNKMGHERFATLEYRYIQALTKDETFKDLDTSKKITNNEHKEFVVLNLIRLLHSQKKYINSFKVFQDSLGENSLSLNYKLIKYVFPMNYLSIIEKHSDNLDPLIIISLIRQESAFNPDASSSVGARGLMQLMPETAKRFNKRVKVKHLQDPQVNISIGAKYFRQLINRFDGNLIYALASYNAGENRIDRWRKEIFRNEDPLATIESIPYEETRNYVKLIYRNKFFYSLLSNKSTLNTPLDESFKVVDSQQR
jgi:soluble lytic murein transglycosylase